MMRLMGLAMGLLAAGSTAWGQGMGIGFARAGDKAPAITLDALTNAPDGAEATWAALGEGTTVIEFWGTWCGPCIAAIPHMNELAEEFEPKGVNFLSVTFEEPGIIEKFRKLRPMESWIGHDMDESMVEAWAVRAWPTTFVVRDGVIIARTSPNALTHQRLAAIVEGKGDPSPEPNSVDLAAPIEEAQVGPDGRPLVKWIRSPGLDPFSMLHTHFDALPPESQPSVQVIVRAAGDFSMASTSNESGSLLGQKLDSIVPRVWGVRRYAVQVDDAIKDKRLDVIYRVPRSRERKDADDMMQAARTLISVGLGVTITKDRRTVDGYELRVGERGVLLPEGGAERSGSSISTNGETMTLTCASMPHSQFVSTIAQQVGAPIDDTTGLEGNYFFEQVLPLERGEFIETVEKETGLVLVPKALEVEVLVVSPR